MTLTSAGSQRNIKISTAVGLGKRARNSQHRKKGRVVSASLVLFLTHLYVEERGIYSVTPSP